MRGFQRSLGVAVLLDARLLDVVGDAGERRHEVLEHRQQLHVEPLGRDRRVDHDDAGDPVRVVGGQPQDQSATHRETADHDGVVLGHQLLEGGGDLGVPLRPGGRVHLLPGGAVAGQPRHLDGVPLRRERLAPRRHRRRLTGEAVAQQHTDLAASGAVGLGGAGERRGERVDRHAPDHAPPERSVDWCLRKCRRTV